MPQIRSRRDAPRGIVSMISGPRQATLAGHKPGLRTPTCTVASRSGSRVRPSNSDTCTAKMHYTSYVNTYVFEGFYY